MHRNLFKIGRTPLFLLRCWPLIPIICCLMTGRHCLFQILVGGRFLEYYKQTRTYHEIGDRKACEKTSQGLREGLSKIRRQMYSDLAAGRLRSGPDTLLVTIGEPLPVERYFEYSYCHLLSPSHRDHVRKKSTSPLVSTIPRILCAKCLLDAVQVHLRKILSAQF